MPLGQPSPCSRIAGANLWQSKDLLHVHSSKTRHLRVISSWFEYMLHYCNIASTTFTTTACSMHCVMRGTQPTSQPFWPPVPAVQQHEPSKIHTPTDTQARHTQVLTIVTCLNGTAIMTQPGQAGTSSHSCADNSRSYCMPAAYTAVLLSPAVCLLLCAAATTEATSPVVARHATQWR